MAVAQAKFRPKSNREFVIEYDPQPKQRALHECVANQVLYGGAAGGGKSHTLRMEAVMWALTVPGVDVYLFRRTLGELEDNHIRKLRELIPTEVGVYNEAKKRINFWNGSGINFCYCEKEQDVTRYQGAEIHVLLVDEAAHLTEFQLTYLRARCRLGEFAKTLDAKMRKRLPRIVFASNPGGPGHQFLKRVFIDASPPEVYFWDETMRDHNVEGHKGWLSAFIPARMNDNKYLDAAYGGQFNNLPPELARALREGDWDSVVGQALHTLRRDRHMIRPFKPPRFWTHFMSFDWGTRRPFSVGWYCVSEGAMLEGKFGEPDRWLPPGAVIRFGEFYGCAGRSDEGLGWDSAHVAREIDRIEHERGYPPMAYRVADSACWNRHDGPSVAERMMEAVPRFSFQKSEKDRKAAYAEFLGRLADDKETGQPMLFVTADCPAFWRVCPTLTLDEKDPEKGPGTKQEDHIYDEVVYALLTRPMQSGFKDERDYEYFQRMQEARRQGAFRPTGRYSTRG